MATGWAERLPLPARGRTAARLHALRALGRADLTLAKLVEPHVDAIAILDDLGDDRAVVTEGSLWGVWAADPPRPRLLATHDADGWRLDGTKPWCSGARACTHALVTAHADDGPRLFAVDLGDRGVAPRPGSWPAIAMAGTDSLHVDMTGVPAVAVGDPGAYVDRAGFWHGGVGVAATWLGGAAGVAAVLQDAGRRDRLDAHGRAHLGAVATALGSADALLDATAARFDASPDDATLARRLAQQVRCHVDAVAREVVDRVARALGPAPLATDRAHARRVGDLQLFVRQSHAERDLADLGASTATGSPW